ncbi:MerR family transcriptional regulator [Neobacillus cucumis]|uniref:MerR family transcriptional regulator n=1 Tax=Neobacillus cucumis TaxID=1740721 RepID=UPI002559CC90|nr:MerR family transcriptional regulator [Neobacillus cucumis]
MYRIGEIASQMNLSRRTIDYYTHLGLLNPVRTDSNYRMYGEESIKILELIEHYKTLNMPLEEIKSVIRMINSCTEIDKEKIEKHCEQLANLMDHLKEEIKVMEPILQKLNNNEKEILVNKLSIQGVTLAQTLLLLFG